MGRGGQEVGRDGRLSTAVVSSIEAWKCHPKEHPGRRPKSARVWLGKADLWAGMATIAFALAALYLSADYGLGRPGRIGAGYVPLVVGLLLLGLGLLLVTRSGRSRDPIDTDIAWRPDALVTGPASGVRAAPRPRRVDGGDHRHGRRRGPCGASGNTLVSMLVSGRDPRRLLLGAVRLMPRSADPRLVVLRAIGHGTFRPTRLRLRTRAHAAEPVFLPDRRAASAPSSACCRGSAPSRPSPCCCRSPSRCRRSPALIMLAGLYYGAQYGGSTTAILVNIPGESSSVVTCIDGP